MYINILSNFYMYTIDLIHLPIEIRHKIEKDIDIDADTSTIILSESQINKYQIPETNILKNTVYFDEDDFACTLEDYVGKHHYYLMFGEPVNTENGYCIIDNIIDIAKRPYDFNLCITDIVGKDAIQCIERSSIVPNGAHLYILGITDLDAHYLQENDSIKEIEAFIRGRII